MTLNEYQRANLRWLLQGCKRNFPQLDTGDWLMELMHMTDGVDVHPNANADAFDAVARKEEESWQRLALKNYEDGCAFRTEMHEYLEALQRLAAMWRPFMGLPMLDLVRAALNRDFSSNHNKEPK